MVFGNLIMKMGNLTGRGVIKMTGWMGLGSIITIMGNYPTRGII